MPPLHQVLILAIMALGPSSGIAGESAWKCPGGIGSSSGDSPKLTWQVSKDFAVIACGWVQEDEELHDRKLFSEFDLFAVKADGKPEKLFTASALESFWLLPQGKQLRLEEMEVVSGKRRPVFSRTLSCAKGRCALSKETCAYTKPSAPNVKSLDDYRRFKKGTLKEQDSLDKMLRGLRDLAFAGNQEAQSMFLTSSTKTKIALGLDGGDAEDFEATKRLLERLRKICHL